MRHVFAVIGLAALAGVGVGVFTLILISAMRHSMLAGAQMPDDNSRLAPIFLLALAPAVAGWLGVKLRERVSGISGPGHTLVQALAAAAAMGAASIGPAMLALDPYPSDATTGVAVGAGMMVIVALITDWAID